MMVGLGLTLLALFLAVGGAFLRQRWFAGWDRPRIGAVDMLFSPRGLLSLVLFGLFHLVWFMAVGVPFVMGMLYLFA